MSRRRVAMLLAKSIEHDTRVMKEARTLAEAGFDVRVFYAADRVPDGLAATPVDYVRVDPRRTVRDAWRRHRARQERLLPLWRRLFALSGRRPRALRYAYYGKNALERQVYLHVNEPARYHEFWLAVHRALDEFAPHVVHAHDASTLYAGWRYARRRHVPLVYDSHELERYTRGRATRYNRFVAAVVETLGVRAASGVITVSPLIAQELRRMYPGACPWIVMNSPVRAAAATAAPFSLRETYGLGAGDRLVVYTGLVIPGRGLGQAIAAFSLLPESYHLAVVGPRETDAEADLRRAVDELGLGERVHFVDPVAGELVVPLIAAADAAIIPTEHASRSADLTLPNKLFEAVMAGLPIAVSGIRGAGEFVRAHELGVAFDIGDAESVAAAVRAVVETPPTIFSDAERLRRLQDEISWERQADVLRTLYDGLPSRRSE